MARQRLIGAWTAAVALFAGCANQNPNQGVIQQPAAAAVLQPEHGGPWNEPIGFVANGTGGRVAVLALKQGRFVTADEGAAFMPSGTLATGRERILGSAAAWAPSDHEVSVFVGDRRRNQILRLPWTVGVEEGTNRPILAATTSTPPVFEDLDQSGDQSQLLVYPTAGVASTEEWTVEWNGAEWIIEGSRSGIQRKTMDSEDWTITDDGAMSLFVVGTASPGDRHRFSVDNGLREMDAGGIPLALAMTTDQQRLFAIVQDEALGRPVIRIFDPVLLEPISDIPLPDDALPNRFTLTPDGDRLFVADRGRSAVWEVKLDEGDALVEHLLPWPVIDVAALRSEGGDRLYVVPTDGSSLWMVDAETDTLIDINLWVPGVQGQTFLSPIRGIEALPVEYDYPETDDDGVQRRGRSVAVALHVGRLVFMEEESGCLVQDGLGPRTAVSASSGTSSDISTNPSTFPSDGPFLEQNDANSRHVVVNRCAGIAKAESWTLRWDSLIQAWAVNASLSGDMPTPAREDGRYVSDDGAVSFTPMSGSRPADDGWQMAFKIADGALSADGDNNGDGTRDVDLSLPGDPVVFHYRVGPDTGSWNKVDDRPFVLVLGEAADMAGRVRPQAGDVEVVWQ